MYKLIPVDKYATYPTNWQIMFKVPRATGKNMTMKPKPRTKQVSKTCNKCIGRCLKFPGESSSNNNHAVPNNSDDIDEAKKHMVKNHCPVGKKRCDNNNGVCSVFNGRIAIHC